MKTLFALVAVAALLSVGTVAASAPTIELQAPTDAEIYCIGLATIICTVYYTVCRPYDVCILR